jgi:energy-coupling factor transporter transmembrane protein EcfT
LSLSKQNNREDITSENILRIADELVHQVDKTKKLVLIMVIAVIVAIPLSWHVTPLFLGSPYNFRVAGIVTIFIAIAFIAIGVRQWMTFSKWTERYKAYKELQAKIDAKLDFENESQP